MRAVLVLAIMAVVALAQDAEECPEPTAMPGFKYAQFTGRWYEVGHYRNAGPSVWSEDCFCSTSNVTQDFLGEAEEDSIYTYDCNVESADGFLQVYDTVLSEMNPAGKWQMTHIPAIVSGPHAFTVLSMDDDSALVYRCGDYGLAGISYTAQFLGRKPALDTIVVDKFKAKVAELKLNPENAALVMVPHGNCTYEGH